MEKLSLFNSVIKRNIGVIEQELDCTALFGALGGSIALNLDNSSSDVDFYLIVDSKMRERVIKKTLFLENIQIDFMCVKLQDVLLNTRSSMRQYPTCFYRTLDEQEEIKRMKDVVRPDFINDMLIRIFMADIILEFKKGIVEKYYNEFKQKITLIEVWDCQFIRAYGNYHESIKDKNEVLLRKYLYTMYEIVTCEMLLKSTKKVFCDFEKLLNTYFGQENDSIKEICRDLVQINQNQELVKAKKYVPCNIKLNEWIEHHLNKTLNEMRENENYMKNNSWSLLEYNIER